MPNRHLADNCTTCVHFGLTRQSYPLSCCFFDPRPRAGKRGCCEHYTDGFRYNGDNRVQLTIRTQR